MSKRLLSLDEASQALHVHPDTLRRWDNSGKLTAIKTKGGHRRYKQSQIDEVMDIEVEEIPDNKQVVAIYSRVSSHDQKQKGDLARQTSRLLQHCMSKNYTASHVIEEVGSGMNDRRSKLNRLLLLAENKEIYKVIIEHKDRLTRFNKEIYLNFFKSHGVEVEWTKEVLEKTYENELVEDMLSIITSFSSRIYGRRSAENRKRKTKCPKK